MRQACFENKNGIKLVSQIISKIFKIPCSKDSQSLFCIKVPHSVSLFSENMAPELIKTFRLRVTHVIV